MSYKIAILEEDYRALRVHLLRDGDSREQAAFLLAGYGRWEGGARLMVREAVPVPDAGFQEHEELRLVIAPEFSNAMIKRAARTNQALILVHTHPGSSGWVGYSPVDDMGEQELFAAFYNRATNRPHASMVVGANVVAGRFWHSDGNHSPADHLLVVGSRLDIIPLNGRPLHSQDGGGELHDRQVRAFGPAGQARIAALTAAVVGLGGTGSITAQQLVRLGVGLLLMVEHDYLEESNVSRVYGSSIMDAWQGLTKLEIAAREARLVGGHTKVEAIQGSVLDEDVALQLRRADVIFGCTDNHWSRTVLNALAYQYYIPLIDMGNRIDSESPPYADGATIRAMAGRVSIVRPGTACLLCSGVIDPSQVRVESLPADEREGLVREGYVAGLEARNPSVISLNTVVAGLAVTELLQLITGFAGEEGAGRAQLLYDAMRGVVRVVKYAASPTCLCSQENFVGAGDELRLPCRSHRANQAA